jgi:hypothetical protein
MKKNRNNKEKKVLKDSEVELTTLQVNPITLNALKTTGKLMSKLDKDLAQFAVCSALSTNYNKFINNFSLCYQIKVLRDDIKNKVVLPTAEVNRENQIWLTVIGAVLGSEVTYN